MADDNNFMTSIISSALAAQDAQEAMTTSESSEIQFSGITEKDGYVGEMVKASLAAMNASESSYKTGDPDQRWDESYTVIISYLVASVAGTEVDTDLSESATYQSLREIIDFIADNIGVNLDDVELDLDGNALHIEAVSDYGKVHVEAGLEAYKHIDVSQIIRL